MAILPDIPIISLEPVGFEQYLTAIDRVLQRVALGNGQTLFVSGEAGLGKSRLVSEVKKQAAQRGFLVLEASCFESDRLLPYTPVLDLLRAIMRVYSLDKPADLSSPSPHERTKVVMELHHDLLEPRLPNQSEQDKHRYSRDLAQFFVQFASTQPVLIVLEDLHWCDSDTLEFLLYLVRMIQTSPALVLATYRSDEAHNDLRHLLANTDRERLGTEIVLERLTVAQVSQMLRTIFGLKRPVRPEFLDAIYALAGGNPHSIEEILRSLGSAGNIYEMEEVSERMPMLTLPVPRSVHDSVQRRLKQVSPEARAVLSLAAIFGNQFDFELLRSLAQCDEPNLLKLIKEVVDARLVVEESADRFAFRDTLTRQAIYSQLLAREKQGLHRKLAETMESGPASKQEDYLPQIAYHFFEAAVWERAMVYSERAGQAALAQFKPRTAVQHLTRAIEAATKLAIVPGPKIYRLRGRAQKILGHLDRAIADHEMAYQIARQMGDRQAEWQALLDLGTLWSRRDYKRSGEYLHQARQLAQEMGKSWTLASSLNQLGTWHLVAEQPLEALRCLHQSLGIYEELQNQRGVAETRGLLGNVSYAMGNLLEAHDHFKRGLALARQVGEKQVLSSILPVSLSIHEPSYLHDTVQIVAHKVSADVRGAGPALRVAQDIQHRLGEIEANYILASVKGAQGDYAGAFPLAEAALLSADEIEYSATRAAANCVLGALHLDIMALEEAKQYLVQGLGFARQSDSRQWIRFNGALLVSTYVAQGDLSAARWLLDDLPAAPAPADGLAARAVLCARAELALAEGDAGIALAIVERLAEPSGGVYSGQNVESTTQNLSLTQPAFRIPHSALQVPRLARLYGDALAGLGRTAESETMLRQSMQAAQAQGALPLLWRIQISLGNLYDRQGARSPAGTEYHNALDVIGDLAAAVPGEALQTAFLNSTTALVPRLYRTALRTISRKEYGGLTVREFEVATLISQGKSTQEMAESIMVSKRTVETHLSSILSKLGFTSRKQIATWAGERDLSGQEAG